MGNGPHWQRTPEDFYSVLFCRETASLPLHLPKPRTISIRNNLRSHKAWKLFSTSHKSGQMRSLSEKHWSQGLVGERDEQP